MKRLMALDEGSFLSARAVRVVEVESVLWDDLSNSMSGMQTCCTFILISVSVPRGEKSLPFLMCQLSVSSWYVAFWPFDTLNKYILILWNHSLFILFYFSFKGFIVL